MTDHTAEPEGVRAQLPRDEAPATVEEAELIRDREAQRLLADDRRKVIDRDWRSEVVYFLLPDRFNADERPDLDLHARLEPPDPTLPDQDRVDRRWDFWAVSGRNRFQGGTIAGITQRIDDGYLVDLGITTLWVGPVWKQRVAGVDRNVGRRDDVSGPPQDDGFPVDLPLGLPGESDRQRRETMRELLTPYDDYHGYAIQDFLQVDPRFGTVESLRSLVRTAHEHGIRVILDVMINHTGENWIYDSTPLDTLRPPYLHDENETGYRPSIGSAYRFGHFLDADNQPMTAPLDDSRRDCGVWPRDLQHDDAYHRRGFGSYGGIEDFKDHNEFRDADWMNRDLRYPDPTEDAPKGARLIDRMVDIWTYWMVTTDCDGFRVDTFKHVPMDTAAEFTHRVRAYAARIGKPDFLVAGEVGGADTASAAYLHLEDQVQGSYPDHLRVRLLEVDKRRQQLRQVAGADPGAPTAEYVLMPTLGAALPPQYLPRLRDDVITTIDDHDGLGVSSTRFAAVYGADAVVPALGLLLFGPGIPCLYYGTEQALQGPTDTRWLGWYGYGDGRAGGDRYLREAMFAPLHPRRAGAGGLLAGEAGIDPHMPGFTPGGPSGSLDPARARAGLFDVQSRTYRATRELTAIRSRHPVLQRGEIHLCLVATASTPFGLSAAAPVVAWTRTLEQDGAAVTRALVVVNNQRLGSPMLTRRVQLPGPVDALQLAVEVTPGGATGRDERLTLSRADQGDFTETSVDIGPCTVQVYLDPSA